MSATAPVPPHSIEAEESVLGAILLAPHLLGTVSELIGAGDFYRQSAGNVFRALLEMDANGIPVDSISCADYMEQHGLLNGDGRNRIHELVLATHATTSTYVTHHARIVAEMSELRQQIEVGSEIARRAYERVGDVENLRDRMEHDVYALTQRHVRGDLELIGSSVRTTYDRIEERAQADLEVLGLSIGYPSLDAILGGLEPGNLVVVAARPSMGKSALAHNVAAKVACKQGLPVALFTFEMSKEEVNQRLLAASARIPLERLRAKPRQLTPDEWGRLQEATARLHEVPLYIDDSSSPTLAEVRSKARRLKTKLPELALIIIDYLQLMHSNEDGHRRQDNRNQEMAEISRGFKVLARQLDLPIVALSQLNRGVELRHDKRPVLSDLRDSGAIEQDPDKIVFIYRDDYYNRESRTPGEAELIVAKNRMGATDTARLRFERRLTLFKEPV